MGNDSQKNDHLFHQADKAKVSSQNIAKPAGNTSKAELSTKQITLTNARTSFKPEDEIGAERRKELDKAWKKAQHKAAIQKTFNVKGAFGKKVSMHLWVVILMAIALIALLLISIVTSGVFGKSSTKDGGSSEHITAYQVCNDLVSEYNKITKDPTSNGSEDVAKRYVNLAIIASRREHSDDDPTCQYIIFYGFFYQGNTEGMASAIDKLGDLEDRGLYPNSSLTGITSIDNMKKLSSNITESN